MSKNLKIKPKTFYHVSTVCVSRYLATTRLTISYFSGRTTHRSGTQQTHTHVRTYIHIQTYIHTHIYTHSIVVYLRPEVTRKDATRDTIREVSVIYVSGSQVDDD